ncbi:DUF4188 domain-containing protein [Halobacteriales archaeon QS_1_67_19]|nr:MAG: DUF4188 domain-containing protein [Halobacteriales archaeon QS_1_67_19]
MSDVNRDRLHAEMDEPFVVFLIGMRINSLWRVWEWLPVFLAMARMLRELADHEALLAARTVPGLRNWMVVQYWRSFEDLEAYARDEGAEHLPAWQRYADEIDPSGSVGIWHETYRVDPDEYETVYNNMPVHGLGEAGRLVPASGRNRRAAGRFGSDGGAAPSNAPPEADDPAADAEE